MPVFRQLDTVEPSPHLYMYRNFKDNILCIYVYNCCACGCQGKVLSHRENYALSTLFMCRSRSLQPAPSAITANRWSAGRCLPLSVRLSVCFSERLLILSLSLSRSGVHCKSKEESLGSENQSKKKQNNFGLYSFDFEFRFCLIPCSFTLFLYCILFCFMVHGQHVIKIVADLGKKRESFLL